MATIDKPYQQWKLPVLANRGLNAHYRELVLHAPELAERVHPGQFINVRCSDSLEPLLRRPFSICRADRRAGAVTVLYAVVGRGTELMSRWEPGVVADVIGPLGNWFPTPEGNGPLALVAGGIGVAPLIALAASLAPSGRPLHAFLGARTADLLLGEAELRELGVEITIATDDGSRGRHGLVTLPLAEQIAAGETHPAFDAILSCGPRPMMAAVARLAHENRLRCYVSMEVEMGCGFGVCMGCAWPTRPAGEAHSTEGGCCGKHAETTDPQYRLVCSDGPVFNAEEILWKR